MRLALKERLEVRLPLVVVLGRHEDLIVAAGVAARLAGDLGQVEDPHEATGAWARRRATVRRKARVRVIGPFGGLTTGHGLSSVLGMESIKTTEDRMQVTIIGPNLYDQSLGSFHVHAAGCRDITRDPKHYGYYESQGGHNMDLDADSAEAVVEFVYGDQMAENPGSTVADYMPDFHFAPCCKGL